MSWYDMVRLEFHRWCLCKWFKLNIGLRWSDHNVVTSELPHLMYYKESVKILYAMQVLMLDLGFMTFIFEGNGIIPLVCSWTSIHALLLLLPVYHGTLYIPHPKLFMELLTMVKLEKSAAVRVCYQ